MGLGFVLFIWLMFWMVVAFLTSTFLGIFTWRFLRQSSEGARRRAILAAVTFPPTAVISAFAGFACYAIWCESVRGVDAGLGDSWRVSLGSGYHLQMIDTPDQAYIETPTGGQLGFGLSRLGYDDKSIYIETEPGKFLLVEKRDGNSAAGLTTNELDAKLKHLGSTRAPLRTPEATYSSLRWGILDLVAALLILALPALLGVGVLFYVVKVRRAAQTAMLNDGTLS